MFTSWKQTTILSATSLLVLSCSTIKQKVLQPTQYLKFCYQEFTYENGKKKRSYIPYSFQYSQEGDTKYISFKNPDGNIPTFRVVNIAKGNMKVSNILVKAEFIKPGEGTHDEAVQDAGPVDIYFDSQNKAYQFGRDGVLLHEYGNCKVDPKGLFEQPIKFQ